MVVDVITYNGEEELFDIRYNILKDHVQEFVVCEARTTFSGKPKEYRFKRIKDKYKNVKYHIIDENYSPEEIELAETSPNTQGAAHWKREFLQKESIKKALTHLQDEDIVFIGDCDEIWKPNEFYPDIGKLKLKVYTYYLNNRSSEEFWGTLVSRYKYVKENCLNHLRSDPPLKSEEYLGWHFTSLAHQIKGKLTDSYTEETYANKDVLSRLDQNVQDRKDFLGRPFTYEITESGWPQYLKDNKNKYKHLLYEPN